jgi:YD repeat-containing protein
MITTMTGHTVRWVCHPGGVRSLCGFRSVVPFATGSGNSSTPAAQRYPTRILKAPGTENEVRHDGTRFLQLDYRNDAIGNRTSMAELDGTRVTWPYDAQNQLLGEHRTGTNPYQQTYTYDPAGNWLLKNIDGARTTYAYDAANQLVYGEALTGRTTYTFDPNGNQQIEREPSGARTTTIWDFENQPRGMLLPIVKRRPDHLHL